MPVLAGGEGPFFGGMWFSTRASVEQIFLKGSGPRLKESIRRIKDLDVEILLSGHGDILVGKEAVQENFRFIENYWFRYI